ASRLDGVRATETASAIASLPRRLTGSVHAGIILIIGAVRVLRRPRAARIVVLVAIASISLASSPFILSVVTAARLVAVSLPAILRLVLVLGIRAAVIAAFAATLVVRARWGDHGQYARRTKQQGQRRKSSGPCPLALHEIPLGVLRSAATPARGPNGVRRSRSP